MCLAAGDWVPFSLNPNLLLPIYRDLYYYHGSLTTPSCSESVQFMIMKQPLLLTQAMVSDVFHTAPVLLLLKHNPPTHTHTATHTSAYTPP